MRETFRKTSATIAALTIAAIGLAAGASASTGALDGKTFVGESGGQGKGPEAKDTLIFHDGKMRSTACDAYGFGEGAYTATVNSYATDFSATTVSAKEGTIEWKGTFYGSDTLEGNYVWTKSGQKPITYWFRAKLKK